MDRILSLEHLNSFRDRNVHIVGVAGSEGFAILEFLLKLGFRRLTVHNLSGGDEMAESFLNAHVALEPGKRREALNRLLTSPARLCSGSDYLEGIRSADLIFATQNWFAHPVNHPLKQARENGIPVHFLTQLYLALSPAPVTAVTGTNGKTTVTTCLTHILTTAGIPCLMSGNDRYHPQVICQLDTLAPDGALVLEISNRQLIELRQGPRMAVLTNIRPDHIDEHGSFEAYRETKASLFRLVPDSGWAIMNAEDPSTPGIAETLDCSVLMYGLREPELPGTAGLSGNQFRLADKNRQYHRLFDLGDPLIPGRHNLMNCLAAASAAFLMGADPDSIREGIRSFRGVRHRIELLAEIEGIRFYDDEASTNPQATAAALESMDFPVVLICGGDVKGNVSDYAFLEPVLNRSVRAVIHLPGQAGILIRDISGDIPVHAAETLRQAMQLADSILRPGDALLLSPAGAGFHSRFNSGSSGFRRLVRDRIRQANRKTKSGGIEGTADVT